MFSRTVGTALVFTSIFASACALSTRKIAEIQDYPGRYYDRPVSIEGTVTSSFSAPLLPVQYYKVSDGTGEMTVVSSDPRGVPRKGARVRVKGHLQEVASLGNRGIGLHLRQEDLDVRR